MTALPLSLSPSHNRGTAPLVVVVGLAITTAQATEPRCFSTDRHTEPRVSTATHPRSLTVRFGIIGCVGRGYQPGTNHLLPPTTGPVSSHSRTVGGLSPECTGEARAKVASDYLMYTAYRVSADEFNRIGELCKYYTKEIRRQIKRSVYLYGREVRETREGERRE